MLPFNDCLLSGGTRGGTWVPLGHLNSDKRRGSDCVGSFVYLFMTMDAKQLQSQARDLLSRLHTLRKQAESLGAIDLRLQIQRRATENAEHSKHFMSMPEQDLSNIDKQQKYKYKLCVKKSKTISGSTTTSGRRRQDQ